MEKIGFLGDFTNSFIDKKINERQATNPAQTRISLDEESKDSYNGKTIEDKENKKVDKANDGKFSIFEAGKNFVKGAISPITAMFSSVKNFAIGAGMMAVGAGLIWATAGAAAIPLIALGLGLGAVTTGVGVYKVATAKNGDDIEKAMFQFGQATFEILTSVLPAKGALKGGILKTTEAGTVVRNAKLAEAIGVTADKANDATEVANFINKMGRTKATIAAIKASGKATKVSWNNLTGKTAKAEAAATAATELAAKKQSVGKNIREYDAKAVVDEKIKNGKFSPETEKPYILKDTQEVIQKLNKKLKDSEITPQEKLEIQESLGKSLKERRYLRKEVAKDSKINDAEHAKKMAKMTPEDDIAMLSDEELTARLTEIKEFKFSDNNSVSQKLSKQRANLEKLNKKPKQNAVEIAKSKNSINDLEWLDTYENRQVKYINERLKKSTSTSEKHGTANVAEAEPIDDVIAKGIAEAKEELKAEGFLDSADTPKKTRTKNAPLDEAQIRANARKDLAETLKVKEDKLDMEISKVLSGEKEISQVYVAQIDDYLQEHGAAEQLATFLEGRKSSASEIVINSTRASKNLIDCYTEMGLTTNDKRVLNFVETAKSEFIKNEAITNESADDSLKYILRHLNKNLKGEKLTEEQFTHITKESVLKPEKAATPAQSGAKTIKNGIDDVIKPQVKPKEVERNISVDEIDNFCEEVNQIGEKVRKIAYKPIANPDKKQTQIIESIENRAKKLDVLYEKATPLQNDQIVYRGLDKDFRGDYKHFLKKFEDSKVGESIVLDPSYAYVGWNKKLTKQYAGLASLEIRLPKGSKIIHHGTEFESIMPRNAEYNVLSKEIGKDGRYNMVLEYVLPK